MTENCITFLVGREDYRTPAKAVLPFSFSSRIPVTWCDSLLYPLSGRHSEVPLAVIH